MNKTTGLGTGGQLVALSVTNGHCAEVSEDDAGVSHGRLSGIEGVWYGMPLSH